MNWAERTTRAIPSEICAADKLDAMVRFTRAHERYKGDPSRREVECLRIQFEALMQPPREGDLLVGRRTELPIGFAPERLVSGVGYFCDEDQLKALKADPSLCVADRERIDELTAYWRGKTTNDKIRARYTDDMRTLLCHGALDKEPGSGFPLYRMAGSQARPDRLLTLGITGMISLVREHAAQNPGLFSALEATLEDFSHIILRYASTVLHRASVEKDPVRQAELAKMVDNLTWISEKPPTTMWQAIQLSYLYYVLAGSFNYGRPDDYLARFLDADLRTGELTEARAYPLIRSLWAMVIERGPAWDGRLALGGRGRASSPSSDRIAMMGLRASHELKDILPQLTFRFYQGMDPTLLEKAIEMIGDGCTYPILYNDDVNIPAVMRAFGVDERTAEQYLPFGCGEYTLYGMSYGTPSGAINLLHALNELIGEGALESSDDFDCFYRKYMDKVKAIIMLLAHQERLEYDACNEEAPFLHLTMLYDDCIARAKPIFGGGIRHLGGTLETYGNTNTSDALVAIKQCVFEQKSVTPEALRAALATNFAGQQALRMRLLDAPKFGNDDPYADEMAVRLHSDVCGAIKDSAKPAGLDSYLNVTINNNMNTVFGLTTGASADGRAANTFMANANNPTGGMDKNGITAMLNSLNKLRVDVHAGSVQNMRFAKEMFAPRLLPKTRALLDAYFAGGGSQAMVSVMGRGDLVRAMERPEDYKNLLVRVGGFSAHFIDLDRDVQLELVSRTLY